MASTVTGQPPPEDALRPEEPSVPQADPGSMVLEMLRRTRKAEKDLRDATVTENDITNTN
ncbi:hypothetical protein E4U19_007243, partial [Claviceps sp. Clav32 group G5]